MIINTEKTKVKIIKSKKITYANLMYDNNNLEKVNSFKYLIIDLLAPKMNPSPWLHFVVDSMAIGSFLKFSFEFF